MTRALRRTVGAGLLAAALAALALTGCAPPPSGGGSASLPANEDQLIAKAKQEGKVVLGAGGHTREQAQLLADKFKEKYGIPVTFVREASGDIAQKTQAQITAHALEFDAVSLNDEATLRVWTDAKVLADPAVANRDQILKPLSNPQNKYLPFTWGALGYSYNAAKTKPETAPTTWDDLAARQGAFGVADPGSSGAALTYVAAMEQINPGFMPALRQRKTLVADSALALTQLLATGEADFGIPGIEADVATAKKGGEPLAMGYPTGRIGALPSYVAALEQAQHPAAARLLVRFQLSPEFQAAQAGIGSRSVLNGAPVPTGAAPITEDRLVVIPAKDVKARKEDLKRTFATAVGR
ncbi:ABC transporter substrate-binding protein [Pseudonocardia acaciae]|uniref:ABC transporter substrate-binding protein n=1 Tax=Pseudonocardia acaciae TaxID=551276 RepID=UPI00048A52E4|nr:extracellular solute-binding protein [Pseudonocardia acaciae]